MNLNLSSFLVPAPPGTNGVASAPATTSTLKVSDGPLFRSALDTQIDLVRVALKEAKAVAGKTGAAVIDTVLDPAAIEAQIAAKIEASLQQGGSFAGAVASLADKLAATVATALGVSDPSGRSQLSQTFARALSPPGTAPPTPAEGARTLARRFRDVAETAARAAVDEGQQKRFLGNILDAATAKDTPAPPKTDEKIPAPSYAFDPLSIARAKVGSPVVSTADESVKRSRPQSPPISADAPAAADFSAPIGSDIPADQRLFVRGFAREELQGSGGDTLLGRTLTRAAKAAEAREGAGIQSEDRTRGQSSAQRPSAARPAAAGQREVPAGHPPAATDTRAVSSEVSLAREAQGEARMQFPELRLVDRTPETHQPTGSSAELNPSPASQPQAGGAPVDAPASPFALPDGQALASKFADVAALTLHAAGKSVHRGTPISHEIDTAIGVTAARNAEISVNATALRKGPDANPDPRNSGSGEPQGNSMPRSAASPLVAQAQAGVVPAGNAALGAFFTAFEQARSAGASAPAPSSADQDSNGQTQSFLASIGASANGSQPASVVIDGSVYTNATPHHPAPDPDPHGVVDQVIKGVFLRNLGPGGSEVRLRLAPEHLGDVTVKLVVDGGSVSAQVLAQTPEARDALLGNQQQLTKTLADAGLKLQHFTVDLSNGNGFAQFNQQQQPQSQSRHMPLRMLSNDEFEGADEETQLLAVPTFGPPVAASAAGSALNTLV